MHVCVLCLHLRSFKIWNKVSLDQTSQGKQQLCFTSALCLQDFNLASSEGQAGGGWENGGGEEGEVEAKEDSDMEGWEDDGWGTFDSPPAPADTPPQEVSSGADFFDNIQTSSSKRTQPRDPFEDFGFSKAQSSKSSQRDRTSPQFTSASLFGGGDMGGKTAGGGVAADKDEGEGGWGDWNSDFDLKPTVKVRIWCKL